MRLKFIFYNVSLLGLMFFSLSLCFDYLTQMRHIDLGARLFSPSAEFFLGTDEMGRSLFSHFIWGGFVTLSTNLVSIYWALICGCILHLLLLGLPEKRRFWLSWCQFLLFVFPSYLFREKWISHLIMLGLCALGVIPLFFIAIVLSVFAPAAFWSAPLILGSLWSFRIAHILLQGHSLRQAIVSSCALFSCNLPLHVKLDYWGLGVSPIQHSWGNLLASQASTVWPYVAVILSILIIAMAGFAISDRASLDTNIQ